MRTKNIFKALSAILLVSGFVFLLSAHNTVYAATKESATEAADKAPVGLNLVNIKDPTKTIFDNGNLLGNTATLYERNEIKDVVILNQDEKTDTSKLGAVWSTNNNFVDMTKKQTMSMWMYFGNKKFNGAGDGMAFVLQNDPRGVDAVAVKKDNTPSGGETLGVWGSDDDQTGVTNPATKAVQNSWALEFDTQPNQSTSYDYLSMGMRGFDLGVDGDYGHIASGYPGESSTYTEAFVSNGSQTAYYYKQNHTNVKSFNLKNVDNTPLLSDGKWKHLTVTLDPTTDPTKITMTYKYEDKDPETLTPKTPLYTDVTTIDLNKFNLKENSKDNQLRWGFTGSVGDSSENNEVVFDTIPSLVEANLTAGIYDVTQDKTLISDDKNISTDDAANTVNVGDTLNLNYNLSYDSGSTSWDSIVADMEIPANFTVNGGKIIYRDKDGNIVKVSQADSESIDETATDGKISHALAKSLTTGETGNANRAEIQLTGVVDKNRKLTADTKISPALATFTSDVYQETVVLPEFTIKYNALELTADQEAISVKSGENAKVTGKVDYNPTNSNYQDADITVHYSLNGGADKTTSVTDHKFSITNAKDDLNPGLNTLKVYATDKTSGRSNTVTYQITVTGALTLTTQNSLRFKSFQSAGSINQIIGRDGDWSIGVNDTRGAGHTWKLMAAATKLANNKTKQVIDGADLIYKDKDGNSELMTSNQVAIATHQTAEGEGIVDASESWSDSTGILLQTTSLVSAGTYTGTINWDLEDSI